MSGPGAKADPVSQRLTDLPPDRRAALERLLRARTTSPVRSEGLVRRADPALPSPLSFAQERLWYLERLFQRRDIFAFPTATRLRGKLDLPALQKAAERTVKRHESLRTTIEVIGDTPFQRVGQDYSVDFDVVTVADGSKSTCSKLANADVLSGFDLSKTPPLRIRVYRLGSDDHVMVINQHIAIADNPSRGILLRDLWNQYEELTTGAAAPLPAMPIQYADFAIWQRKRLQGQRLATLLEYWRDQLTDAPHKLALVTDRPRPARHGGSGRFLYVDAPAGLGDAVRAMAQRLRTTPSVFLLACYRIVLWEVSGQDDFVIGSPKSERAHPETENLIGYFVNVLPLRSQVHAGDTVKDVVELQHHHALAAFARQELPFERLVQEINPIRESGVPPLYQVSYSYFAGAMQQLHTTPGGLAAEPFPIRSEGTEYDLGVNVIHDSELGSQWPYNDEILDEETVLALARRFWAVVSRAVSDVDSVVADLCQEGPGLLAPQHSRPVRADAGKASEAPVAVAVYSAAKSLTSHRFASLADAVAEKLASHGVSGGSTVLVRAEEATQLPAALLGVWQAGCSWSAHTGAAAGDPMGSAWTLFVADGSLHLSAPAGGTAQPGHPAPGAVIWESGKLTYVSRAQLISAARAFTELTGPITRLYSSAPHDSALFAHELVLVLQTGAELVVGSAGAQGDELTAEVGQWQPSHWLAPAQAWAAASGTSKVPAQTTLVVFGPLSRHAAAKLHATGSKVWHGYFTAAMGGPVILSPLTPTLPFGAVLGHPMSSVTAEVRHPSGRAILPGAAGELWLAGEAGVPGTPTGKFARWRRSGEIEIIGDIADLRVLHGIPTHPAELLGMLPEDAGVLDAAFVTRLEAPQPVFHGYIALASDADASTAAILATLCSRLPSHVVPTITQVGQLPYLPSGELDRDGLPAPHIMGLADSVQPPEGSLERDIAAIWSDLLATTQISANDNFFDLGGHSLLLHTLSTRLVEMTGGHVPLAELLEHQTVASQASLLRELGLELA